MGGWLDLRAVPVFHPDWKSWRATKGKLIRETLEPEWWDSGGAAVAAAVVCCETSDLTLCIHLCCGVKKGIYFFCCCCVTPSLFVRASCVLRELLSGKRNQMISNEILYKSLKIIGACLADFLSNFLFFFTIHLNLFRLHVSLFCIIVHKFLLVIFEQVTNTSESLPVRLAF